MQSTEAMIPHVELCWHVFVQQCEYTAANTFTHLLLSVSFNEHASSYPSVSFSLCASLRFKVLIIFAVVFFLSSRRRTEVSPQGSLNFHPQSLKQRSEGFINSARH